MKLLETQFLFTKLLPRLFDHAYARGYNLTLGEAHRTPEQAALNAKSGKGIKNSLHIKRLAIDLNLFKNGKLLQNSEDHKFLGEFWEQLGKKEGVPTRWGGRFKDGNHYSIEFEGVK